MKEKYYIECEINDRKCMFWFGPDISLYDIKFIFQAILMFYEFSPELAMELFNDREE